MKNPLSLLNHLASCARPVSRTRSAARNLFVLLLVAEASFTSHAQSNLCATTPSGLRAWWPAEGNAADVTGNHNGIITTQFTGNVSFSPGKVGTAFDFTGSDFVELEPLALSNFTIECWLNQRTRVPVTPNSSWGCFLISDEVCGVQDDWHLGLLNGGQLLFHIGDGSGGVDYQFPSDGIIPLNTYVHVAVTRSTVTGKIELYINGVLDRTFTAPHNRVVGLANPDCDIYPNTIGIGNIRRHAALGISNNFDGLIDEPAIYNRALSAAEIATIYNAGSAGKCEATNPPPVCVPAPAGLVAWWSGDNSPAELIHGNNGTLSGGAVYTNAIVGAGFSLDGLDDRVVVADAPVLDFGSNQDLSIECWIKAYPNSNPSNVRAIVDKRNAAENYRGYTLFLWDGFLAFQLSEISKGVNYFSSGADLRDGVFHHVAVTVDRDSASGGRLYVDGQIIYTFDPTGVMGDLSNSDVLRIGQHAAPGGASSFPGVIDDVAIYNRALSTAEIQSVYQAGGAGKCTAVAPAPLLLNVDFGAGLAGTTKTGFAAIGQTANDFWNFYTREDGAGGWRTFGALPDLKTANGATTAIGMAVINAPGAWGNGSSDPMYVDYIYPFDGGDVTVVVSNLPAGNYDVLAYGYDGNYEVFSAGQYRGVQTNYDAHRSNPPVWTPGLQYVHFTNIIVAPWEPLVLTARPGRDGYAVISGMQIAAAITNVVAETNCTTIPAGLVAWWRGEDNASDENGVNNGTLLNGTTFAAGEVGQAFVFNDATADVRIPASPSINVGIGAGFTIEAWIAPATLTPQPVFEWNSGTGYDDIGAHLWISASPSGPGPAGNLFANLRDTARGSHFISSAAGVVATNRFQHVALTYDKASGAAVLYCNGIAVADQNVGALTLFTTYDLHLGRRAGGYFSEAYYRGMIDEASLYSRALSAAEIQSIYNAASAGKCAPTNPPPQISAIPVISSFSPTVATNGSTIIISGTNFSPVASSNIVYFGAVRASVTAASSNSLTVTVPAGATHAPITVTVAGLTAAARTAFTPTFPGGAAISTASFSPRVNLGTGDGPTGTAIADFDGDGKPDLAVTDDYGHTLSVYRNISVAGTLDAGSFAPRVELPARPTEYSPYMIVTGDVDGDGKLDLITTDVGGNSVSVYRNQAVSGDLNSNSFALFVSFAVGAGPRAVALADLDADGRPEIVTANYDASTVSVLRNIGVAGQISSNSFAPRFDLSAGAGAHGLAVADLDGDGRPDLATANAVGASLSLFRNVGSGSVASNSFGSAVTIPGPNFAHFVRAADLDADGRSELLLTSYLGQTLTVYRNQADSGVLDTNSFAAGITLALAGRGHTISLGDLNGDTKVDIAVDTEIGDSIALFQNQSVPGGFTNDSLAARVDLAAGWNAWGSSVGDLDGDGRPDIIFANAYDDTISLYRNVTALSNQPPVSCAPTPLGLVASWPAEGNAADVTGNHNGIITTQFNGSVSFSPGKVGTAFDFTGSDFVELQPFPLTNFTIECWLNQRTRVPVTPNSSWGCFVISDEVCGVADDWHLGLLNGGQLLFHIGDGAGGGDYQFPSTNTIPLNTYVHVAVTRSTVTGKIELYINGVLDSTFTAPHNRVVGMAGPWCDIYPNTIGIGNIRRHAALGISNNFDGLIDEPAIYSQALSAADIAAIYNAGSAGKCPPSAMAPSISRQPQSATVAAGANVQLDVTATGIPAPTYQWFFGTAAQAGQTNATLFLNNVQPSQAGDYFVIVANPSGSITSSVATLTVQTFPPTITSQPQDWSVYAGKMVAFTVQATGTAPLRYQWSHDGTALPNVTSTLTLLNVQSNHAGIYQVIVSNDYGSATSRLAQLTVTPPPPCAPAPDGVIAWWPGESNLWDVVGGYDGIVPQNSLLYTTGKVGAALFFNSSFAYVATAPKGGLNVNTNSGLTIEGWIRPDASGPRPIAEWNDGKVVGAGLMLSVVGPGTIEATLTDTNFPVRTVTIRSPDFTITNLLWQHVALTYDKGAGVATILVNGNPVVQTNIGTMTPNTSGNVYLGFRPVGPYGNSRFRGALDEITLYNRALSAAELQSIIAADEIGKCPPPPPACIKPPADIAAWWRGESNTVDSVAGNDAVRIPTNFPVTQFYQAGQVGVAFSLQNPRFFAVPRAEGLDVGTGAGLTVEAWILPNTLSPMPIVEWTDTNSYGVNLWMSSSRGPTVLEANLIDTAGGFHLIRSPINTIRVYSWQHVAVTYDKTTGVAALYSDGNLVTTTNLGFFTPRTHTELQIGFHPRNTVSGPDGTPPTIDYRFNGAIDELAIYRRALSAAEIRNVARQRPGKCLELPPTISRHPQEQVALEGGTARFEVGVGGTAPFQYQWLFAGEAIAAGTNSFLALTGIEPADAGPYSVLVSNAFGSVTSRVAALTVLPANQCLPTPFGSVAFWRGQSNTLDELGSHPAQWGTNTLPAYTTVQTGGGKVATAFRFTGQNYLQVPTNSNLNVGAGGGFTIEGWIKPENFNPQSLLDWNDGRGNIGVGLMLGLTGPGALEVTLTDTNAVSSARVITLTTPNYTIGSPTNPLPRWAHVALTFDKLARRVALYVDGRLVAERSVPMVIYFTPSEDPKFFSPTTTGNLYFGWRPSGVNAGLRFRGAMDEMAVYYRALTPLELQAIYVVGANGKCTPAPACQPLASGIISWWRGESNVLDSVDGNHGSNNPAPLYTNGIVGSGFRITSGRYIQIPAHPALHVGAGSGFTFETWLRLDNQSQYTIAAWNSGSLTQGVSFGSSPTRGPNYFEANLVDTLGFSHGLSFYTYPSPISGTLITAQKWHHLALTYDKPSGQAILFLNGSPVVVTNLGSFTPRTTGPLTLGYRPPGNYPGSGIGLTGALDETTLYNRALSSGEITANYRNVANRCLMPPVIVSHPGNVRVNPGSNVTFQVIAEGNPLLRYQWGMDRSPGALNSPLPGQTNSLLLLTNVQTKDAGRYWVQVTNAFGAVVSSNINLIVNSPPNAFNQSITTAEDTSRRFLLLASDANQDALTFTVLTQPTNGTLSATSSNWVYTPALNYHGPDSFTFKVSDGLLESSPATVSITVTPVNDPPTVASQIVATDEDTPLPITLAAADVDGDALTFNITPPAHGTLSGTAPDLIYTPHANFFGDDLFMFTVRDGSNAVSELAVVNITVHPVNDAPVARIVVAPLDEMPGVTNLVALAPACCEATLRLDASESSDVENDALTYTWLEGTNILSTAITATNRFNAGTHEITLLVSDGTNVTPATVIVEIITPAEAIAFLQTLVEEGIAETRDRMPLLNWLNGASEAMERCQVEQGSRFLESFQQRIRDRIASKDAELAAALIETSTTIMEAAPDCDPSQRLGRPQKTKHEDRGRPEFPSTDSARSSRTR